MVIPAFPVLPSWPEPSAIPWFRRTWLLWFLAVMFLAGLGLATVGAARRASLRHGDEAIRTRALLTGAALAQHELLAERSCQRYLLTGDSEALTYFQEAQNGIKSSLAEARALAMQLAPGAPDLGAQVEGVRTRLWTWQSVYALPAIELRLGERWEELARFNRRGGQAHWITDVDNAIRDVRAQLLAASDASEAAHLPDVETATLLFHLGLVFQCCALATVIPLGWRTVSGIRDRNLLSIALKKFTGDIREATTETDLAGVIARAAMAAGDIVQCNVVLPRGRGAGLTVTTALGWQPASRRVSAILEQPQLCPVMKTGRPHVVANVRMQVVCKCPFGVPSHGAYACLPLVSHGGAYGLVNVQAAAPRHMRQEHLRNHLEALGFIGSLAMASQQDLSRMENAAMTDVLTGLYNRRFLEASLTHHLAVASRNLTPFTILMMDFDHFKLFNDTHGHAAGDALLKAFGGHVRPMMREMDILARYGGEEFVAVLPETTVAQAEGMGERLRSRVRTMAVPGLEDLPLPVATLSMGVGSYPEHGTSVEGLLRAADRALYRAKEGGRDQIGRYIAVPAVT